LATPIRATVGAPKCIGVTKLLPNILPVSSFDPDSQYFNFLLAALSKLTLVEIPDHPHRRLWNILA